MNNQYIWSLFYLGEIDAMSRHIQLVLQDARSRGDLFSTSGMVNIHLYTTEPAVGMERIRLGTVLGGDEGKELADSGNSFMQSQGIRNIPAMTRLLAPGWDRE